MASLAENPILIDDEDDKEKFSPLPWTSVSEKPVRLLCWRDVVTSEQEKKMFLIFFGKVILIE